MKEYDQLRACLWVLENYGDELSAALTTRLLANAHECLVAITDNINGAVSHR